MQASQSPKMLRPLLLLLATYLVAWFVLFSILTEFDYPYLLRYFAYAWSGGFELPAFIQLGAIAVTALVGAVLGIRFAARRRAH